ncbi:MAG: YfhO family protein [Cytophagaceae bacterium]|nr:YfhO family protein [Cytophagaceae bacterium]MDW8455591.1 YfhO family protein [Cytophagaceae bacterium]
MQKNFLKNVLPHSLANLAFIILLCFYFSPALQGKLIYQHDIIQATGFLKESIDYEKKTGEEILWTNSMFSGMPAWRGYSSNVFKHIHKFCTTIVPSVIYITYLLFLGFYILMLAMRANVWLCFMMSAAFAFSSFNIIGIQAGHLNKILDVALMAPVVAGVLLIYKKKYYSGAAILAFFLSYHLYYGHFQITYYLIIVLLFTIAGYFVQAVKEKQIPAFIKASLVALIAAIIATGPNISQLWTTQVYSRSTARGGSELTTKQKAYGSGLDKDYVYNWSNGVTEIFTTFIPYFHGGASQELLDKKSAVYEALKENNIDANQVIAQPFPLYWGDQPSTAGPVYFGATIFFLFVLAMILLKDQIKWWIFAVTLLAFFLSMGKNFETFSDLFYYYAPLYNKFRAVTMIICIAQLTFPFLAAMLLIKIFNNEIDFKTFFNGLKWAVIGCGGFALLCALLATMFFSFQSENDAEFAKSYPEWLMEALMEDRESKFRWDALRSLFFVMATAAVLWAYMKKKIQPTTAGLILIAITLFDLIPVDRRYLNNTHFKLKKNWQTKVFATSQADETILSDPDPHYRVFNLTSGNPFAESMTSYHHKSIGGYSAIKMARYQDLIDSFLYKQDMNVISMLNTKYIIYPDKDKNPVVQRNPMAMGNAWFVDTFRLVKNADEEIVALKKFDPEKEVIVDDDFKNQLEGFRPSGDTSKKIQLVSYHPNRLKYSYNAVSEQLVVFSEVYYQPGWNAYIDGKLTPHFRANYILRAMRVPPGSHTIEFKFEPKHYFTGEKISAAGSALLFVFIGTMIFFEIRKSSKDMKAS